MRSNFCLACVRKKLVVREKYQDFFKNYEKAQTEEIFKDKINFLKAEKCFYNMRIIFSLACVGEKLTVSEL